MPTSIIVSHYNRWPTTQLVALLDQIHTIPAGAPFAVTVVVNQELPEPLVLPERHAGTDVLYRENTGYNIGAWEHGWRQRPGFDHYLFLQEECRILRPGWLAPFRRLAARPSVGAIGESLHWAGLSWQRLRRQYRDLPFVAPVDGRQVPFSAGIQAGLNRLGLAEGATGAHLQSLVLYLRRDVLEAIGGFRIGLTYGEATIAEVAISKQVAALGLKVREVGPGSFRYILHPQWQRRQGVVRTALRAVAARLPFSLANWAKGIILPNAHG